ncbi:MAG: AbrB/MazE/SpoVT family DNA-binding domain-containing protein [Anaerolineales bacterium]|nr:AbrB/MazE/SpoVT family DNA-binding domain-containing protein [Anaerolineales bacterium]
MTASIKVRANYRISIPQIARKKLKIKRGDCLVVEVEGNAMFLICQPKRHAKYLRDKIWNGVDVEKYINDERDSWNVQQNQ